MPLSDLLTASTVSRHVLQSGREFFEWLYREYDKPERCQLEYWAWFTGLETSALISSETKGQTSIAANSAAWPWLKLQRWLRDVVEALFSSVEQGKMVRIRGRERFVTRLTDWKGRDALRFRPRWPPKPNAKAWLLYGLDELLCDLDGVAQESLARCAICDHFFIRVVARRGEYCSAHCRNRALQHTHRRRHTVKQGARKPRAKAARK